MAKFVGKYNGIDIASMSYIERKSILTDLSNSANFHIDEIIERYKKRLDIAIASEIAKRNGYIESKIASLTEQIELLKTDRRSLSTSNYDAIVRYIIKNGGVEGYLENGNIYRHYTGRQNRRIQARDLEDINLHHFLKMHFVTSDHDMSSAELDGITKKEEVVSDAIVEYRNKVVEYIYKKFGEMEAFCYSKNMDKKIASMFNKKSVQRYLSKHGYEDVGAYIVKIAHYISSQPFFVPQEFVKKFQEFTTFPNIKVADAIGVDKKELALCILATLLNKDATENAFQESEKEFQKRRRPLERRIEILQSRKAKNIEEVHNQFMPLSELLSDVLDLQNNIASTKGRLELIAGAEAFEIENYTQAELFELQVALLKNIPNRVSDAFLACINPTESGLYNGIKSGQPTKSLPKKFPMSK